jgi:hypothetical protein
VSPARQAGLLLELKYAASVAELIDRVERGDAFPDAASPADGIECALG